MRLSLTRLRQRAAEAADEAAAGSSVPAGADSESRGRQGPSARERGAMRRRARQLRRRREALLLELGALVFEMHRRDRLEPDLIDRKADEIRLVDDEERGLTEALGGRSRLVEVVAAGITGACPSCGALVGTDARFCQSCGTPVGREAGSGRERRPAPARQRVSDAVATGSDAVEEPAPRPDGEPASSDAGR